MAEGIIETAAAVASSVTGPETPSNVSVRSSTKGAEWTLFAALAALCVFALILIGVLTWVRWPETTSEQRIRFLGWMGWLSTGGILLIIIAIASPWVGRVEAKAGDASVVIDGKDRPQG
jgi:hypothetical protein